MGKQNVIFILADDMGYGDFGIFGDGRPKTPTLDRLVEEGLTMSHYYSASPVCTPARASIMTGRYPHRTGAVDTYERTGMDRLALDETTIADVYRNNGYRTGLFGKWHLGGVGGDYHPMKRGFDEFIGIPWGWSHYFDYMVDNNGHMEKGNGYLTDVISRESVNFINRNKEQPFFLYVAYNAPHFPFECPEEYIAMFRDGVITEEVATIYAMIYCMDKGISSILEAVKANGLEEDTIVVFTSDNGPQLWGNFNRYNRYLQGEKGSCHDGGIRVPAIIRYPNKIKPGIKYHGFFHGCDWFPTLLKACDIPVSSHLKIDGISRLPELYGEQDTEYPINRYWQYNRFTPVSRCNAAVKKNKWKLVWPSIKEAFEYSHEVIDQDEEWKDNLDMIVEDIIPYDDSGRIIPPPHPPKLYNLENDPFEQNDLSSRYPEITASLTREFCQWFEDVETDWKRTVFEKK